MMETFWTEIGRRDFAPEVWAGPRFEARSLSWAEPGGPERAVLFAPLPAGNGQVVIEDLLRRPLTVYSAAGDPLWWGYIHAVKQAGGAGPVECSLDGLANRVAVRYVERQPVVEWLGGERQTAWQEDRRSIASLGRKERVIELPHAPRAAAEQACATWLKKLSRPVTKVLSQPTEPGIWLEARGWWQTLDWVHYAQPAGRAAYTAAGSISLSVGSSSSSREFCQLFTVSQAWSASEVWLSLGRSAKPADNLIVELVRWGASGPAQTLAGVTAAAALIPNGREWVRFELPAPAALQAGLTYGVRVRRSGGISSTAFCYAGGAAEAAGPGALMEWNGTAWVASTRADVMLFQVAGVSGTLAQAADLLAPGQAGQFLRGARLPQVSAAAQLYRDGRRTALDELLDLLAAGDGAGNELRASVSPERWLLVRSAAGDEPRIWLGPGGEVLDRAGRPLEPGRQVTGHLARSGERTVTIRAVEWRPGLGRLATRVE